MCRSRAGVGCFAEAGDSAQELRVLREPVAELGEAEESCGHALAGDLLEQLLESILFSDLDHVVSDHQGVTRTVRQQLLRFWLSFELALERAQIERLLCLKDRPRSNEVGGARWVLPHQRIHSAIASKGEERVGAEACGEPLGIEESTHKCLKFLT